MKAGESSAYVRFACVTEVRGCSAATVPVPVERVIGWIVERTKEEEGVEKGERERRICAGETHQPRPAAPVAVSAIVVVPAVGTAVGVAAAVITVAVAVGAAEAFAVVAGAPYAAAAADEAGRGKARLQLHCLLSLPWQWSHMYRPS